jgi:hypothetical protein
MRDPRNFMVRLPISSLHLGRRLVSSTASLPMPAASVEAAPRPASLGFAAEAGMRERSVVVRAPTLLWRR